ncbi:MAG: hypothetical protein VCA37_19915 [Roseibacillus sp.]
MRKAISFILACLTSVAIAADTKDVPAPAPADDPSAATTAADEVDPSPEGTEPEGPSEAELLAELEAAAALAEEEEAAQLAKAAKARKAAKGEKLDTLSTKRGRTYNKVTISGVDEVGVKIVHEAGTARIKFAELPDLFQRRFGYDPNRADELLNRERALARARDLAAIAGLRAEAGLPPEPKITRTTGPTITRRPTITRPKVTRPKTTGPRVTKPRDVTSDPDPDVATTDTRADVAALNVKIAALESSIKQIKVVAEGFDKEERKANDRAFANAAKTAGDGKVDQSKLAKAKEWRDKAQAEYDKISSAKSTITKYRREIKNLERGSR